MTSRKLTVSDFTLASADKITEAIITINREDAEEEKKVVGYKRQPIELFINSYGGQVYSLLSMMSVIKVSKTPIHTICLGAAMSCGFILFICGHKRFVGINATLMYHAISNFSWGQIETLKEDLIEAERLQINIEDTTVLKTRILREKLAEIRRLKKDWFMSSSEAMRLGVATDYFEM